MRFKSVNVLGERYKVYVRVPPGGNENFGECHEHDLKIFLHPGQAKDRMRDTFLHEVIHAISGATGLKLKEMEVRSLATGLRAVFAANPQFAKFVSQ